jgi:menaquinone-specific isochorismate synthase
VTDPLRDALDTLRAAHGQPRFLFASEGQVRFGIGIHRRIEEPGPERLQRTAHAIRQVTPDALVMGGFAFDPGHDATGPWAAFPASLFVVPALEWEWRPDGWHEHRNGSSYGQYPPAPASKRGGGSPASWDEQVAAALEAINAGQVEKVVLARCVEGPPLADPFEAFARLVTAEPQGHAYYLEPFPGYAFFGATPERLARVRDQRVETHAVAGTAPRGDAATDASLGQRLLVGDKETREHRLVVDHIVLRLQALGLSPEQGMRRLRRLASVQHLETQVSARATADLGALDVAAALHPTPAVCGVPVEAAAALLARLEGRPRGWYAGGVGWLRPNGEGEMFVALRSALATPDGTWLYAGAGIVAGSEAKAEYDETEAKLLRLREAVLA